MFSMCSELAPRAHVPDNRIPQLMQPCSSPPQACSNSTNNKYVRYFSWLGVRLWKSWQRLMQRKKVSWDKREWFLKLCLCSPKIKWVENEGLYTCPTLGRGSTSSLEACQVFLHSNTSCLNTVARNLVTKKRDAMSSSGKLRTSTVLDYGLSSPNRF